VWHDFDDRETAESFAGFDELKAAMAEAGVVSAPIIWVTDEVLGQRSRALSAWWVGDGPTSDSRGSASPWPMAANIKLRRGGQIPEPAPSAITSSQPG
jgi:hypothetical protein